MRQELLAKRLNDSCTLAVNFLVTALRNICILQRTHNTTAMSIKFDISLIILVRHTGIHFNIQQINIVNNFLETREHLHTDE